MRFWRVAWRHFGLLMLEEPAVGHEGGIGRGRGDKKSGKPVEKPEAKNVGAHKAPARTKSGGESGPRRAFLELSLPMEVGVIIHFPDIAADGWIGVMMKIAGDFFCVALHFDFAMLLGPRPSAAFTFEQAQNVIGVPIAMRDPASEKPDLARKTGTGKLPRVVAKKLADGIVQGRRNFFIGVQGENPWLPRVGEDKIFLVAKALPRMAKNSGAEFFCNLFGAIVHVFVEQDNDFGGPARDTGEEFFDPAHFRAGDDANRNRQWIHERWIIVRGAEVAQIKKIRDE